MANTNNTMETPLMHQAMGEVTKPGAPISRVPRVSGGALGASEVLAGFDCTGLPANFVERLIRDSQGGAEYARISSVSDIKTRPANSSYWSVCCAKSCLCCCRQGTLVEDGQLGVVNDNGVFEFLAPGYHGASNFGIEMQPAVSVNVVDQAVAYGTVGYVTVSEAKVGVLLVGSSFKLLAPGSYQWSSPRVQFLKVTSVLDQIVKLGPYTLVTVPVGKVAVTFNNGELVILGHDATSAASADDRIEGAHAPRRTYFLENAKWQLESFLPMTMQTDRLEGNDLLSKDNVEVLMVAMSQWRIADPVRAVTHCASTMEAIRTTVNQLVRATIARIVAGTNIGAGPVSGAKSRPVVQGFVVDEDSAAAEQQQQAASNKDDADLAHLMKSHMAEEHMAELNVQMEIMGIDVCGVFVPEKRMKNDDIRQEVAKQAVIGIKADAERAAADARAYSTVKAARAEAEAIALLASAHSDAGARLGDPTTTASRLALSETMAKAMGGSNLTVFSGAPESMPFMFGAPPQQQQQQRRTAAPAIGRTPEV